MSELKVNKISPRTACGTVTLGDSGDTFTIPSGATITNAGTASGFGATGAVSWDTSSIKTAGFTATAGIGYFCNTTGGIFTVALPAGSAGDVVGIADYAQTFNNNNLTVSPDGSEKIGGTAANATMSVDGVAATLVYVDGTQGWTVTDSGSSDDVPGPKYVTATGGTPCSGAIVCTNYKVHTFTGPGTLTVSCAGNPTGSSLIDYMIVGGGGAGGSGNPASGEGGGAAGAGGWRASAGTGSGCYTAGPSPLTAPVSGITAAATPYAIVVGGGGAGQPAPTCESGADGNVSSAFCISSAGGGGGGTRSYTTPIDIAAGNPGGSGGGSTYVGPSGGTGTVGTGNTPPTTPPQGNDGGLRVCSGGGGGGGAVSAGGTPPGSTVGGAGGTGSVSCITGSPVGYAGGGGGGAPTTGGPATQGGGTGSVGSGAGGSGSVNTGGGGGGGKGPQASGGGGSGVVIIRYKFQ